MAIDEEYNWLYFGGTFSSVTVPGLTVNYFARLNLTSGQMYDYGGTNSIVNAIKIVKTGGETHVYIGGTFTEAGGVTHQRLADLRFTSPLVSSWLNLLVYVPNGQVYAIDATTSGDLLVGGSFNQLCSTIYGCGTASNVGRWNYSAGSWTTFGAGCDGVVNTITSIPSTDTFYVGGQFAHAGGVLAPYIAKYDGATFIRMSPGGMNDQVYATYVAPNGDLYIGGAFTLVNGVSAYRIAKYKFATQTWENIGDSGGVVFALARHPSSLYLYVGGGFTAIGGTTAYKLAQYYDTDDAGATQTAIAIPTQTSAAAATQTAQAGATQTAVAGATQTAIAGVTQTAIVGATQTAVAATSTAQAGATQTAIAATATAQSGATQTAWAATMTAQPALTQTAMVATGTAEAGATQTAIAATGTAEAGATQTAWAATQTAWVATQTANAPTQTPTPTVTLTPTTTPSLTPTSGPQAVQPIYLPLIFRWYAPSPIEINEAEPNDTFAQANPVMSLPSIIHGHHDGTAGTGDIFRFSLAAGNLLEVSINTDNATGLQILLYDTEGREVARAVAAPYTLDAVAVSTGEYYLYVYTAGDTHNLGAYTLEISIGEGLGMVNASTQALTPMDKATRNKSPEIAIP